MSKISISDLCFAVEQHIPSAFLPSQEISDINLQSQNQFPRSEENAEENLLAGLLLGLLVVLKAISDGRIENACSLATLLVKRALEVNMRELDTLVARIFFYYALSMQKKGDMDTLCRNMLVAYRSCVIRGDMDCQAVLVNSILMTYVSTGKVAIAEKFASRITFPPADNSQSARYMFYLGRIKALSGDYNASLRFLFGAVRKAPSSRHRAIGFQQTVHKLLVLVQLHSGEIPEREMFRSAILQKSLSAYFSLTSGDLMMFENVLSQYKAAFERDGNYDLVLGLRQNVIKTGVRLVNAVYSRISLRDVALKLQLSSEAEAAAAIKHSIDEGAIDAVIVDDSIMESRETMDVYATAEPQETLFSRTKFCIQLREEAVQAMRYPGTEKMEIFAEHTTVPSGDDGLDMGDDGDDFDDLL